MTADAPETKADWRRKLRQRLRDLPPEARAEAAGRLCQRVLGAPWWVAARVVLLYAPLPDEIDISPLGTAALAAGKELALPRHRPESDTYEACAVREIARDLAPGRFGIREPRPGCPSVELNRLDLVLVPGVGFTPGGCRLGRGRGDYDRLLAGVRGLKCGVAYDPQVVPSLPHAPHDVVLDCILTPTQWWSAGSRAVL